MNLNRNQLEEIIRYEFRRLYEQGPPGGPPESKYQQIRYQFNRKVVNDALETIASQLSKVGSTEVLAQELNATNGRLDISSFNAGVYLAQVQIEGQTKTFKFIKK